MGCNLYSCFTWKRRCHIYYIQFTLWLQKFLISHGQIVTDVCFFLSYRDGTSIILSDDVGQLYILNTGQGESQQDAKYDQVCWSPEVLWLHRLGFSKWFLMHVLNSFFLEIIALSFRMQMEMSLTRLVIYQFLTKLSLCSCAAYSRNYKLRKDYRD